MSDQNVGGGLTKAGVSETSAPSLSDALQGLLNRYVSLVESGDAGNWDAETEPVVIAARAALVPRQGDAALQSPPSSEGATFDIFVHLARQAAWSEKTFGPGMRTAGVCDHIRKELIEIAADPTDLKEWIDVVILALDGAWRCGGTPEQIVAGIVAKQAKNEGRVWPDWRTADPDKAIEHDRSHDAPLSQPAIKEAPSASPGATLPQPLLNLIGEYGMARTDRVSEAEVLHRWQLLIAGIKEYAALSSAQPAQGAQAVPDGQAYGIVDPDYARVYTQARIVAWQYGYACVMHGSFTRDLDLLLVPWEENARDNHEQLLKLIAQGSGLRFRDGVEEIHKAKVDFTEKPHGRKSCSLYFPTFGDRRWIDISVLAAAPKPPAVQEGE